MSAISATSQATRVGEGWRLEAASSEDLADVATAVGKLLGELSGKPSALPPAALEAAARTLIEDEEAGVVRICRSDAGQMIGLLGASFQVSIRTAGRYALIQELWVDRQWQGRGIGSALLDALETLASERGMERLEVGLPTSNYDQLATTEAFYAANRFTAVGTRMRRLL